MSKLNSLQRKLVYLGGIIVLFIPILLLGQPGRVAVEPTETTPGRSAEAGGNSIRCVRIMIWGTPTWEPSIRPARR